MYQEIIDAIRQNDNFAVSLASLRVQMNCMMEEEKGETNAAI